MLNPKDAVGGEQSRRCIKNMKPGQETATGGRGFNPSRCTVECDLGRVVGTHCPATLKLRPHGAIYIGLNCKKSS